MKEMVLSAMVRGLARVIAAQLAKSDGWAQIGHLPDLLFVELCDALSRAGFTQKVVADAFGLQRRTLQRRLQARRETLGYDRKTLWYAIYELARERGRVTREMVDQRFGGDGVENVRAILRKQVEAGLLAKSGRGENCVYYAIERLPHQPSPAFAAEGLAADDEVVWVAVYESGTSSAEKLLARSGITSNAGRTNFINALNRLLKRDFIKVDFEGRYSCKAYTIPLSDKVRLGPIYDHYMAMIDTLCDSLSGVPEDIAIRAEVGGSTYRFGLTHGSQYEAEIRGLLAELRTRLSTLRVALDAETEARKEPKAMETVFYLGQTIQPTKPSYLEVPR